MEIWRSKDGSDIAITAATWELNPRISFESLADEFRRNPAKAWRNFGSVVTTNVEAAIKEPHAVEKRRNMARPDPWHYTQHKYHEWFVGRRGVRYFMHFDLSKNRDATGIAVVHREPHSGVLVVDFMFQHRPQPGRDVNYAGLREVFVYPLLDRGFRIACVSFDGFQSDESRQVLEERGIHTDYCSADKTTGPYDTLIEYLTTDRLDFYNHPIFLREFEELRLLNGVKYDHPRKFKDGTTGSKDVADAVACAGFMSVNDLLDNPSEPPGKITVHRVKWPTYGERSQWG